jgi:putative membrane protein
MPYFTKEVLMEILSKILIAIVALEHVYILILEMFFWTRAKTMKIFAMEKELSTKTTALAANQGLYNGFLAAGLFWGLFNGNASFGHDIVLFFLVCVLTAAVYGSITVKKSILLVQGLPAFLAFLFILFL